MDRPPRLAATASKNAPVGTGSQNWAGKSNAPWSEVVLLACLAMLGLIAMDMYLPALPRMAADLLAAPQRTQATVSSFLLGLAVGQLVFGPLSDRVGRRPPILGGLALFCLATILCALSPNVEFLIGARFLQAFGACAGMVIHRAVVRDRYRDHEVMHVFSLLSLVFALPPVLAPLIGGWVLTVADWRWIFGAQALFGVAVGIATFARLPESRSDVTRERARGEKVLTSYRSLLRQPLLIGYVLVGAFSGASLFSYIASASRVLVSEFHISAVHFGWVFGVNGIGIAVCAQINARLARRVSCDVLIRGALLTSLVSGLILAACASTGVGGPLGVLLPLFLVISMIGFLQPNTTTAAMAVNLHLSGATASLIGFAFFGVGSLSGLAVSLVPGRTSAGMGLVVALTQAMALLAYLAIVTPQLRYKRGPIALGRGL